MPRAKYYYKTPLGDFPSAIAAARALKCDRSTIMNRCETEPELYKKIRVEPKPPANETWRMNWPLTWREYRVLDNDVREGIFTNWCQHCGLDPDQESTVDQFFDEMDRVSEFDPTETEDELELD